MKLTPAQQRLLIAIDDAGSRGITPGEAAFQAGFRGNGRNGAGRAPQWTGRVFRNLPEGLARWNYRAKGSAILELTDLGRRAIRDIRNA